MADQKRDVRALGQRITGLKVGDNVTLVLKKPKPKVDATSAKRAKKVSDDKIKQAKDALNLLRAAKQAAEGGDGATARKQVGEAQKLFDQVNGAISRAKDWAKAAAEDASSAPGEVKDGYEAAK